MSRITSRKFKADLDQLQDEVTGSTGLVIRHGYLSLGDERSCIVRLEAVECELHAGREIQTISPNGTKVCLDLSEADFNRLWPLTEGKRVIKTRHWSGEKEIDVYLDIPLTTVKIDFHSREEADAMCTLESWILDEITNRDAYSTRALALQGK